MNQLTDLYHAKLAWAVRQSGDFELFTSIGGGIRRRHASTGPGFGFSQASPVVLAGLGVRQRVLPYLALRAEMEWVLAGEATLRLAGGVSVPIGRYRQAQRLTREPSPALASGELDKVKAGHRVSVTTNDGNVCRGTVRSISRAAIDLVCVQGQRTIAVADIRTVEGNDSIGDGILYGALAGAGVGALVGRARGQHDSDGWELYGWTYAGLYAGIGALAGAVIDYRHEGRHLIFHAATPTTTVAVAPVIVRRGAGVGGVVQW